MVKRAPRAGLTPLTPLELDGGSAQRATRCRDAARGPVPGKFHAWFVSGQVD